MGIGSFACCFNTVVVVLDFIVLQIVSYGMTNEVIINIKHFIVVSFTPSNTGYFAAEHIPFESVILNCLYFSCFNHQKMV